MGLVIFRLGPEALGALSFLSIEPGPLQNILSGEEKNSLIFQRVYFNLIATGHKPCRFTFYFSVAY